MNAKHVAKQRTPAQRPVHFAACALLLLASCSLVQAPAQDTQNAGSNPQITVSGLQGIGGAEILSDTQGVNFAPYLKGILNEIYVHWLPLLPEEAHPPQRLAGESQIRFTINPTGQVAAMHLDASTHSDSLNKAAWGAITAVGAFPQLPDAFHGPNLELRIRFKVNEDSSKKIGF